MIGKNCFVVIVVLALASFSGACSKDCTTCSVSPVGPSTPSTPTTPTTPTCTYSASVTSISLTSAESASGNVAITASSSSCSNAWTATSSVAWITLSPTSGTGNGQVAYSISANTGVARTGMVTVAGQTVTVSQAAVTSTPTPTPTPTCTYNVTGGNMSPSAMGGTYTFTMNTQAGCAWTVTSNIPWITVIGGSGVGTGTFQLVIATNTDGARSGSLTVMGITITINQSASTTTPPTTPTCSFTLSLRTIDFTAVSTAGSFSVVASSPSCSWSASTTSSWITLTRASGTGSGDVQFQVSANTSSARSGSIAFAGQGVAVQNVPISQASGVVTPVACTTLDLPHASADLGATSTSAGFTVDTFGVNCSWNASTSASWITITAGSGVGNGGVQYTVSANTGIARSGNITVGNKFFTVNQAGTTPPGCTFTIQSSMTVPKDSAGNSFSVGTQNGCSWTATTATSWVSITNDSGIGSGSVRFTTTTNSTSAQRNGAITVTGSGGFSQAVAIVQPGQ